MADRALATVVFLGLKMGRPIFLEGEAGVGKTEIAKVLAEALGRRLIRLQCYEGLDVSTAVYEWNYSAQMIEIRLAEAVGISDRDRLQEEIFSSRFLIRRPLLQALDGAPGAAPVLLIVQPPRGHRLRRRQRRSREGIRRRILSGAHALPGLRLVSERPHRRAMPERTLPGV